MGDVTLSFIDTETTGLDYVRHEVWEVGIILENSKDDRYPDGEYLWQIRPLRLDLAESAALKISRYHERKAVPANEDWQAVCHSWADETHDVVVSRQSLAQTIAEMTIDARLVGAIPSFDELRVGNFLRSNGQIPMWHYHIVDIEAMMCGYLAARAAFDSGGHIMNELDVARPPWNSRELSEACGVKQVEDEVHTALGDAKWARDVYHAILD